ncbi:MAG: DNA-binding response regulator [Burkholderia sp.]|jgi:DNA-binding response OmpR family regulator
MPRRILVVDDDLGHVENVLDFCSARGWEAAGAGSAADAEAKMKADAFDLVLLDISMPGENGLDFCRRLRHKGFDGLILMCTSDDALDTKVHGLELGADDYITKPFSLRELGARIEAALRRLRPEKLQVGDLVFDVAALRVTRGGREIDLKPIPLRILNELMRRSPNPVSRTELERIVWNGNPPDSDSLRANMYLLRQAVDKPFEKHLIATHPGRGWSVSE